MLDLGTTRTTLLVFHGFSLRNPCSLSEAPDIQVIQMDGESEANTRDDQCHCSDLDSRGWIGSEFLDGC